MDNSELRVHVRQSDLRGRIIGNAHTHRGLFNVETDDGRILSYSAGEVQPDTSAAESWLSGFLEGSAPNPVDVLGPDWEERYPDGRTIWRRAKDNFLLSGVWYSDAPSSQTWKFDRDAIAQLSQTLSLEEVDRGYEILAIHPSGISIVARIDPTLRVVELELTNSAVATPSVAIKLEHCDAVLALPSEQPHLMVTTEEPRALDCTINLLGFPILTLEEI